MYKKLITSLAFLLIGVQLISQTNWPYDFIKGSIEVKIDPFKEEIRGKVRYKLTALDHLDSLYLDARDMELNTVRLNGKEVAYKYDGKKIVVGKSLGRGKRYRLEISYRTQPAQAVYFLGWQDSIPRNEQVWTQGQGKYTSNWVPAPDDMNEKIIIDLAISFDKGYEVIANGRLRNARTARSQKIWKYKMDRPMSSYLLAFAIGDYVSSTSSSRSGIPIFLYSYRKDHQKSEPTYRYSEEIFNFLESEIGVPYPWQNYKQVPVRDFLYAGMENTGLTIYSDGYVVDSTAFRDLNYVNVNAHELAHQWFGNMVTETDAGQHWLHEGLATYYAYLSEKQIFGEDYFYWKLWDTAQQLKQQDARGQGEALTDPKAGSLTFYEKGAWAALMLNEAVGKEIFRKSIREFLEEYAFNNATLSQFFTVFEEQCRCSLEDFRKTWFDSATFPYKQAEDHLRKKSPSVGSFLKLQQELMVRPETNEDIVQEYWNDIDDPELKGRIIKGYSTSLSEHFLKNVAREDLLKVNQAVAVSLPSVTPEMQTTFESFLETPSYITRENALYKLWISFPDKRKQYLNATSGVFGLPNRSFRLTWLLLSLLTPDYGTPETKANWEKELRGYTANYNGFEVRQTAFVVIHDVLGLNDQNLKDLAQACVHHVWQFRNFARNLMEELLRDEVYRHRVQGMLSELGQKERVYLNKSLGS
ncbi:M1 family metallopeptidase [Lentiprolixibacter aurantiacus]|uniref:Aminopeptidase N n=1 Tax=Lentiprolixibacter aurantiacus TaxID=2993939 RepID=A0AAE3ML28_9FLAO|nr:M1 family metallopeptidase [Lentiprolixibacter aurantiacus]MCX2719696.1 M1 family metallopeptidase [Lentiprolixibacter aurantiacus]